MVIASKEWEINSLDIKAAFLQGKALTRDVYLKPPREANMRGKLWKLKQYVYGLDDASRNFYMTVKEQLLKVGCRCSQLDQAVFTYHNPDLEGLLMSHVDDFLWAGSTQFEVSVIDRIRSTFKVSSENSNSFTYVGIQVQLYSDGIYISQKDYTNELEMIPTKHLSDRKPDDLITEEEKHSLRSTIGSLNWLAGQTRPDLSYDVCQLSSSLKEGSVNLLGHANRVIKKAKAYDVSLHFPKMDLNNLSVYCYSDASHGNLSNGGSQGGLFTEIRCGSMSCPIEWQSKRIRRMAKSTLSAETIAMVEAMDSAFYIKHLLQDMIFNNKPQDIPIYCLTDNYSLFQTAHSTTAVTERRLRIEIACVREAIDRGEVDLKWVSSKDQYADCLTKATCDTQKLLSRISRIDD